MSAFITEWNMPVGDFTLPLRSGYTYNMVVDWGDGSPTSTVTAFDDVAATYNYAVAGTYQISITGTCSAWYINTGTVKLLLTKVIQWGDVGFTGGGLASAFYGASNLTTLPDGQITGANTVNSLERTFSDSGITSIPSGFLDLLVDVTTVNYLFYRCYSLEECPDYLFRYNVNIFNYYYTFQNCSKLKLKKYLFSPPSEYETRFLNKSANFYYTFSRSSWAGTTPGEAPELWLYDFGNGTVYNKNTTFVGNGNSLDSLSNYCQIPSEWGRSTECPKLWTFLSEKTGEKTLKLIAVTNAVVPAEDEIKMYFSLTEIGLIAVENLIDFTTTDNITFEATTTLPDAVDYYGAVEYYTNGVLSETLTTSGFFTWVEQVDTTIINITNSLNYKILNNPIHSLNHGLIFHDGYIYGSARGDSEAYTGTSIFKINAADYTLYEGLKIYRNKNTLSGLVFKIEQIVYCKGYIWAQTSDLIIRVNPTDLSYILFEKSYFGVRGEPVGTDGIYLYGYETDLTNYNYYNVLKIDTDQLLGTDVYFGYTGDAPVAFPLAAIIGTCPIIRKSTAFSEWAFVHSIVIDNQFIYLAVTTSVGDYLNGYIATTDTYILHFQKIDKQTMQTVGDITIPKTTDDMGQNSEYVFLSLEYQEGADGLYGSEWGLLAIHKQTLEIKYLKSLHTDFLSSVTFRRTYGIFYFNNRIAVQLVDTKKTVVIDVSQIERWGENFAIGGATNAIYSFQLNGIDMLAPCNELVLDNAGWIHVNTWQSETIIFKFLNTEMPGIEKTPVIQTNLISSSSNNAAIGGFVIDEGMSPITDVGFRYGTDPLNLNINVDVTPDTYDFQTELLSLAPDIYYIQAWGVNTEGTWYGHTVVFSTYNKMTLSNEDDALLEWISENYGCSIRCVQDAPGEVDGVTGTATDQDGNVYNTVVINEKRWFVENLKVVTYRDGTAIPNITDNTEWSNDTDGAYSSYENK